MKNNNKYTPDENDKVLNNLFQEFELDSPSDQMKKNIMMDVLHQWAVKPEIKSSSSWNENKIWLFIGISSLVIFALLADYFNFLGWLNTEKLNIDLSAFNSIADTFKGLFSNSSGYGGIIVLTSLGVVILLGLESILKKTSNQNHWT